MKAELTVSDRDGCTATISGCGIGGHTARFLFQAPEYGPVEVPFDGDEVSYHRDILHGSVLITIVDSEDFWDQRATLEAYEPDTARRRKKPTDGETAAMEGAE